MASQHNRSGAYKALIGGNQASVTSREEELHKRVYGDAPREKKPHGLPSEAELNEELRTMKVNARSYSSIAGASSTSFDEYRVLRRQEHERMEKMYADAERELKEEKFVTTKRAREEAEEEKTAQKASKRLKKKEAQKKRAEAFKQQQKEQKQTQPQQQQPAKEEASASPAGTAPAPAPAPPAAGATAEPSAASGAAEEKEPTKEKEKDTEGIAASNTPAVASSE